MEAWQSLGNAMDLDETRECQEHEYEFKNAEDRRCLWHKCEYHTKRPPKMRVCMGCNEVASVIPGGMSMSGAHAMSIRDIALGPVRESTSRHHRFHAVSNMLHRDWKEGGHRVRCRRLKDVPQSFIELQDREDERHAPSP